jgi:hypothetical protein
MTLTLKVLFLLTFAILGACANIRTVKIAQEYNSAETKIAIVPIESGGLYIAPSGWGMLFGAAGVVVEHAATASKREALAQNIKETWGDWRPEAVLRDKLAEELTKRGRTVIQETEILPLPENIRDSSLAAQKWYNPDVTVFDHSTIMNRYNPTAIMEVGFEEPGIIGHRVIIVSLIKVVDPRTKNLIARRRVVKNMATGKYKLKDPIQRQLYVADFKTTFGKEMAKAVPKMLDDIGF